MLNSKSQASTTANSSTKDVAVIGSGSVSKCMSRALIESESNLVSKNQCEVYKPQKESSILILPNGYTKEEIEKLIIEHNISRDTIIGTLNKEGLFETIDGNVMELQRGFDFSHKKETSFPITNPYKDLKEIEILFKKKPKAKKAYWHKGKLKYK